MTGCGSIKYLYVHKREGYAGFNIIKYGFFNVFFALSPSNVTAQTLWRGVKSVQCW